MLASATSSSRVAPAPMMRSSVIAQLCDKHAASHDHRGSDLHLCAQFHQPVARNAEETSSRGRIAVHEGEQLVTPDRHATVRAGDDGFTAGEKGGVHRIEIDA